MILSRAKKPAEMNLMHLLCSRVEKKVMLGSHVWEIIWFSKG